MMLEHLHVKHEIFISENTLDEVRCLKIVLIVKIGKEEYSLETCFEKDLKVIKPLVKFFY